MSPEVPHREVDPLDAMAKPNPRVVLYGTAGGFPGSGDPTPAAKQNRTVQPRGCNLVPSLAHRNNATFGDQRTGESNFHLLAGRTTRQIVGGYDPWKERVWDFGGKLEYDNSVGRWSSFSMSNLSLLTSI